MAEILIRKRRTPLEDARPVGMSDLKWNARGQQGDIAEVQPNGFYRIEALGTGTHGWDRNAYALVRITNLSLAAAAYLHGSYSNAVGDNPPTVRYKNRYRINLWANIPWIKNTVTINGVQVEEWYYIRPNLTGIAIVDKVT